MKKTAHELEAIKSAEPSNACGPDSHDWIQVYCANVFSSPVLRWKCDECGCDGGAVRENE